MGSLTTSGAVKRKMGVNANSSLLLSGAAFVNFIDQAEAFIVSETRYDWITNFSSVLSGAKTILDDVASSKAALAGINYDMSGYSGKREAETMLDYNHDVVTKGLIILKDKKTEDFMV